MSLSKNIVIGSLFSFGLTASAALAQPQVHSLPHQFSTPRFERQPLPKAFGTAKAWKTIAHNAFIAQDYVNSIAAFGKAIDLAPKGDRPKLLEARGWVHYRLGQFDRADQDFRKAASLLIANEQWSAYTNVRQMRQFVNVQAARMDSTS